MMSRSRDLLLAVGKEVVRREHDYFDEAALDDRRHIPRVERIAAAIAAAVREEGGSEDEASALHEELVAYGRELWLDLCVSNAVEGEDLDAFREESAEIFREIRTADDPWSAYS